MNVLIIATNRCRNPMPVMPLGACMVAEAAAAAGHRVRVLDLMFLRNPGQAVAAAIREWQPEVIGLSVRNIDNNDMAQPVFFPAELLPLLAVIRQCSSAPVILGGAAVAVMPEELLRFTGADCAVCGEGETVFPALLARLSGGGVPGDLPGLAWLEDDQYRVNLLPPSDVSRACQAPDFPRWLEIGGYRRHLATVPLQTKLGCQFHCVYCTYRKIEGDTYRTAEPAGVAQAVRRLADMGLRDIEVVDNVFNAPHWHAMAVCEELARARLKVQLQSLELNPAFLDDDLLLAMQAAGFTGVGVTVESAAGPVLKGLGKGFTPEKVHAAADIIGRHQLPCLWIFLFGGPGETPDTVRETLAFAKSAIRPRDIAFFTVGLRIYPGTELEKIARRQGVLQCERREMLAPVFYLSPEVDGGWLRREVKKAMAERLNFLDGESLGLSFLPTLNIIGGKLGLRPPLWKHSRHIRRGLRLVGMDA
jgi:radical SAM superfamily enzyme YgiQ (UPF0313 family)